MSLFGIGRRFYRGFKRNYAFSRRRAIRSSLSRRASRSWYRGYTGR